MTRTHPLELFSIPFPYRINMSKLTDIYFNLQKTTHPDLVVDKSSSNIQHAQLLASNLNKAYGILKNPLTRYESILRYLNAPLSQPLSSKFLETQMTLREREENLQTQEEKVNFKKEIEEKFQHAEHIFYQGIERKNLLFAVDAYQSMVYLLRLLEKMDNA